MKIYSMTATFGKLEHEQLTLTPGLNIIEAPNEWGKSTWCAFLAAMLYGLDTRAKSTKNGLADKERYAPWSGSPMAGRMDINWNGRDITIERTTKGRIPLGNVRAYETATGLEVPELNASNCGQLLLGVERSVFIRSGFIRLSDLPVTDDEALRRRLNNLVTTGDENDAGDRLARELKTLKNRIRYNRTGLLPQAEGERTALEAKCRELEELKEQSDQTLQRLDRTEDWRILLENHRTALSYAMAQEDERQVAQALMARNEAQAYLKQTEDECSIYPQRETAQEVLDEINRLQGELEDLKTEAASLPELKELTHVPKIFLGLGGEEAVALAKIHRDKHHSLTKPNTALWAVCIALMVLGPLIALWCRIPGLICCGAGVATIVLMAVLTSSRRKQADSLAKHYRDPEPERWVWEAEEYANALREQKYAREQRREQQLALQQRLAALEETIREATQGQGLKVCREDWESVIAAWDAYEVAQKEWEQAEHHYQALRSMVKTAPAPEFPDRMDYSEQETIRLLSECRAEGMQLQKRLAQYQGRIEALGDPLMLEEKLAAVNSRIEKLEQMYAALTIAQETLAEAAAELQRRFAPRISRRAQELMSRLTDGRYERLSISDDLRLRAGAEQEDILREALWRSDGTVDQLYLALRLAVSEELTPDAPLILDDALVRFDDERMKAAMEILKEESQHKQVILFTCQSREKDMI